MGVDLLVVLPIPRPPRGMPLGDDPSGFRIVRVGPHGLDHAYFGLESVPERLGGR